MELADVRGGTGLADDVNAEMDAAFGYGTEADELTEREIDAMFVEEMERRDREAREVFGGDDDTDPRPTPPAAALPVDAENYPASAARFTDDELITAVSIGDEDPTYLQLDPVRRAAWLDAMTSEVLARLGRKAA